MTFPSRHGCRCRVIPSARTVDSNVNRRGSTQCDSPSALDGGAVMTVAITCLDLSSADLREAAARTPDAKATRRMLAIALLLEGWSREAAAEACAMERQTLRDWVQRYNEAGLDGLYDRRRRNGPPPRLSPSSRPRWRHGWSRARIWSGTVWYVGAASICSGGSRREFAVTLHERTVGKLLRKLSFRRLSVRPHHPQGKAEDHAVFSAVSPIS